MRKELIERLSVITPEEEAILKGNTLDLSIYNRGGKAMVETGRILPKGELFGVRTHTRFAPFPRHGHQYVEMVYQVEGETKHIVNGITEITLSQGQLLFLGRGTEHEILATEKEDIAINFILIPAFFDNAAISIGGNDALSVFLKGNLKNSDLQTGHLLFDIRGVELIENLLENLVLGQLNGTALMLQQLTLELLLQHLSGMAEKLVVQTQEDHDRAIVLNILSRIEREVRVNLSEIAEALNVDVTVLSRLIQKYTGCTFTELMHTARFNRAVTMLRDTKMSVADIATAIGYENTAFFYRRFSKLYGCTPAEYRKKHQEDLQNRI